MNTKVEEALAVIRACRHSWQIVEEIDAVDAHIAQQDATIARMREALEACLDYGSMTDDGWVTDKARAALNQEQGK